MNTKTLNTESRLKALTAWLNREAGNPSHFKFKIEPHGLPQIYFKVDLNGNGQCVDDFLVITIEESGTVKHSFSRDLTDDDCFKYKGETWVIVSSDT